MIQSSNFMRSVLPIALNMLKKKSNPECHFKKRSIEGVTSRCPAYFSILRETTDWQEIFFSSMWTIQYLAYHIKLNWFYYFSKFLISANRTTVYSVQRHRTPYSKVNIHRNRFNCSTYFCLVKKSMLTHVNSWIFPEQGCENPAFERVSLMMKEKNQSNRKKRGEEIPKWKGKQRKTKEKACQVYSSDCKIFSLAALGEIQLCVLVHALPIRGGVSFATLMFLARGKTVILFSASNVWSVTALKVRGVLWSVGMHQQKRIFLSISYMLYRLLWILLKAYCLRFFSQEN